MDLPIYLGLGLLASGYMLNGKSKQPRPRPKIDSRERESQNENKKAGNHNILDSAYFYKVREIEDEKVIKNFEKSFDPINTQIIPYFFNNLSEVAQKRVQNPLYDRNLFQKEMAHIMKDTPITLTRLEPVPNDLTVINQDASVESGGWQGSPPRGLFANTTLNTNFGPSGGSGGGGGASASDTYGTVMSRPEGSHGTNNRENFSMPMTHNNMVPFFRGSSKQNMNIENRLYADKLESFTGQFKLNKQHKTEVGALFAPVQQDTTTITPPRQLDRFTTNLQVRNNELPFEQIRVGHGLNDGFTARPTGGFHNPLRILPKTIDQLLVNPKVTSEGRVIRGKDPVDKRTAQSQQYKYRPELLVTNFEGERNFTTTGAWLKPMVRSKQVIRATNRNKSRKVMGVAHEQTGSKSTPSNRLPFVKMSTKRTFKNTPYRNPVQAAGKKPIIDAHLTFENKRNERSVTEKRYGEKNYGFYNRKFDVGQGQTYLYDKAKTTRSQAYAINQYPTGYVKTTKVKGRTYDPKQELKTTHRQTTETQSHAGSITIATKGKGRVYNPQEDLKTTHRETTETNHHAGSLMSLTKGKGKVYNPTEELKTTHRETTETNHHAGSLMSLTKGKGKVYNPTEDLKTTHRETTETNSHSGHVQAPSSLKGQAYDPNDVTRTTLRELTETNATQGQIQVGGGKGKGKVYTGEARATIRESTERTDNVGNVSHSIVTKQTCYDPEDVAKTTIKETTERTDGFGIVSNPIKTKQKCYDPEDVAKTTIKETTERTDEIGIVSHPIVTKQICYDPYDVPNVTFREMTEDMTYLTSGDAGYLQNGYGYQTAPLDVKDTARQTLTDYYYVKGAGPAEAPENQTDREDVYNMRQNTNMEVVAQGRYPTLSNVKLANGKDSVSIEIKKLDQDRLNQYSAARAPTFPDAKPPANVCQLTSFKNNLPPFNPYFDPSVLSAFNSNPLSQSLNSWS